MSEAANDPWNEFLDHVYAYVNRCQKEFADEFGQHEQFFYDLDARKLTFSNGGVAALECSILVAGSSSTISGTWLWSWANPHLPIDVTARLGVVREYGEERGFHYLTDEKWGAEENDCWLAAGIACYLLSSQAVYRAPAKNGATFLLIQDSRRVG